MTPEAIIARAHANADLVRAIAHREAGPVLLRFDSVDDLVQGVMHEVARSVGGFEWRGEEAFTGWLALVTRRHLATRRDYWFSHKRNPAAVVRLGMSGSMAGAGTATGPATFAARRELLTQASRAMAMLLPRDREIVAWIAEGQSTASFASRLGLSPDAAERARSRALERLRKAFAILAKSGSIS